MQPRDWFRAWLKEHKELNPHNQWRTYEQPGFARIYRGWVRAFRVRGIRLEDAKEASVRMQAEGKFYPDKTLGQVVRLAEKAKAERLDAEWESRRAERITSDERERAYEAEVKSLWGGLPEKAKDRYRREVIQEMPYYSHRPQWVEPIARMKWAESRPGVRNPASRVA